MMDRLDLRQGQGRRPGTAARTRLARRTPRVECLEARTLMTITLAPAR